MTRRDFGKLSLTTMSTAPAFAGANSVYKGVQFGICSYSFRGMGLDELIRQMAAVPMGQLELENVFVEPVPAQREATREWRLGVSLDEIRAIRLKLDNAGIDVFAYNIAINDTFTDSELDRVFRIAKILGARAVNSASTLPVVPRLAEMAAQHNLRVGLHPSFGAAADVAIGTGESYRKALAVSPRIGANPDLNGWRVWGTEPLAFIRELSGRMTTMHTHDSKATGPRPVAVPFGEGDNPIREVLRMMQKERMGFVAMIERTYNLPEGADNIAEQRKCLAYCRAALE